MGISTDTAEKIRLNGMVICGVVGSFTALADVIFGGIQALNDKVDNSFVENVIDVVTSVPSLIGFGISFASFVVAGVGQTLVDKGSYSGRRGSGRVHRRT